MATEAQKMLERDQKGYLEFAKSNSIDFARQLGRAGVSDNALGMARLAVENGIEAAQHSR